MDTKSAWIKVNEEKLRQGDWLPDFPLLEFDYAKLQKAIAEQTSSEITIKRHNMFILTHSCDFEQKKAHLVTMCPITTKEAFITKNPHLLSNNKWGNIETNKCKDLHVLPSPEKPDERDKVIILHFRHLYTVPLDFVNEHVKTLGDRWRLNSPNLEGCSRRFGDLFSNVAVPAPPWEKSTEYKKEHAPTIF